MKIQFAVVMRNRRGEDLEEPDMKNPPAVRKITLADICCMVLDIQMPGDKDNPKEKARRWDLVRRISEAETTLAPLDLLDSDVEMLKARIWASNYPASLCGIAVECLRPISEPVAVGEAA